MNANPELRRILLLCPSFEDPGGVAAFCRLLMKRISPVGKIVHFEVGNRPWNKNPMRQLSFFMGDALRLVRTLTTNRYDLVHLNPSLEILSFIRDSFYLWLVSRIFQRKTLIFFHGWNIKIARRIASNRFWRSLFRRLYEKAGRILVLCASYKDQLGRMGLNQAQIDVITTMYEAEESGSKESAKNDSVAIQILFMGRLVKAKGVYIAAEAARLLIKNGTRDFRLVFAGDGPELAGIRKYGDEFGLKDHILTPGYLKGREKWAALENSHIFLYPTYYGEGCPIVVLEAMGAGLAIVSTPVAAIPEVVEDGVNGFLIESREAGDFLPSLKRLIDDPALLKRMRTANREKASANFEARVVTRKIESIYSSIIEPPSATGQGAAGGTGNQQRTTKQHRRDQKGKRCAALRL